MDCFSRFVFGNAFWQNENFNGSLVEKWNDHVSNVLSTELFLTQGTAIYSEPTGVVWDRVHGEVGIKPELRDQIVSPQLPRHYPPGLWAALTPISIALNRNLIDLPQAARLAIGLYLLAALLAAGLLAHLLASLLRDHNKRTFKLLTTVVLMLASMELVRWALNGMYDPIAILGLLCFVWALKTKNYPIAYLAFGVSLFFHFRALWLAPAGAWALWKFWRQYREQLISFSSLAIL